MGSIKDLFRRKENPAERSIFATVSPGQAIWTPKNYANLTTAGYLNCAAVFSCVSLIAKTASRIDWILYDRKGDELEASPLLDLLHRPNEDESGIRFTEKVFTFLLLAGNSYIAKLQGGGRDLEGRSFPPKFLYTLRPDRTTVIPGTWDNRVAGYKYDAGATPIDFTADSVKHLMEVHPLHDWYGLSRLEVAAKQVDISNEAAAWNKSILQNSVIPAGVLNFKSGLTEEQRKELRKQIEYRSAGSANAGKFLMTEGEGTWTQMGMTAKDIDFLNGQKFTMRQICAIFGIPSELLGDSENKTYSNYQEARRALYEETVLPLMDIYVDELNAWLVPLYGPGLELDYDKDAIEALQEERARKYAYLAQATWLTINDKRKATGYEELTSGDVLLVPISEIPLEQAAEPAEPAGEGGGGDPDPGAGKGVITRLYAAGEGKGACCRTIKAVKKSFWTTNGRRAKLWTATESRARTRELTFRQVQKRYMERQAAAVLREIEKHKTVGEISARDLLDVEAEAKRYRQEFKSWYIDHAIRAGNAGLAATKGELFDDGEFKAQVKAGEAPKKWAFKFTPAREEKLMQMIFNSGTKVNESTIDIIYSTLHASQSENATIEQFTQQIWEQVDWMSPARARLWAETETTKVENWGMVEGYRDAEFVERKGWNCQQLATSRDEHLEADGQEVPLDDPFEIGGEQLDAPGDPAGSAWNVCNCRCSTYPVVPEG